LPGAGGRLSDGRLFGCGTRFGSDGRGLVSGRFTGAFISWRLFGCGCAGTPRFS
jgi:hypothetical protein